MEKTIKFKVVDNIIDEQDGRKGFEFSDLDGDILDEIKVSLSLIVIEAIEFAYDKGVKDGIEKLQKSLN